MKYTKISLLVSQFIVGIALIISWFSKSFCATVNATSANLFGQLLLLFALDLLVEIAIKVEKMEEKINSLENEE